MKQLSLAMIKSIVAINQLHLKQHLLCAKVVECLAFSGLLTPKLIPSPASLS